MLPPDIKAKYEKMAEEENRKQRAIFEEQRKKKARKLGLPSDATWDMIDSQNPHLKLRLIRLVVQSKG